MSNHRGSSFDDFLQEYGIALPQIGNDLLQKIFDPFLPMIFLDCKSLDAQDSTEFKETKELESIFNFTEINIVVDLIFSILWSALRSNLDMKEIHKKLQNGAGRLC